jgi:peptide/nickel transport system substrate-binding protein
VTSGALLLLALGCSSPQTFNREPIHLTIGVPESYASAPDVGLGQIAQILSYEGLNYKGPDGHPEPRLAESWTTSEDGRHWHFTLRRGVQFHDGTPVNAERIAASLNTILAQKGTIALRPGLLDVTNISATDESTLTIALKNPSSFLIDELDIHLGAHGPPGPESAGTGLFRITSIDSSQTTLEANERYYLGAPAIKQITLRAYPTLRTAWAALMRGEIDMVSEVAHDALEFVSNDSVATYSFLRNYMYVIAFNSRRPQFRDAAVRRALNAAVDRAELIRSVLKGRGIPATGPLWPRHWAVDGSVPGFTFDPAVATSTLDAAGVKAPAPGSGGHLPARLRFVCLVPQNFAVVERLALAVQKQLYDVGVDMQVEAVSPDNYNVRIRNGNFDAVFVDLIGGPTFARPYQFWRSPGELKGLNVFGYHNSEADRWLDALRFAPDEAAIRSAATQAQRVMRDDPPALFLIWNERTRAISRRFNVPGDGSRDPLYTLRMWSVNPDFRRTTN